jgi:hypothetical protein
MKQPQLDMSQAATYTCEQCDNDRFIVTYLIKRFSPLVSPTGEEMIVPVSCFACTLCGHINADFQPENNSLG